MKKKSTRIAYFVALWCLFIVLLVILGISFKDTPLPTFVYEDETVTAATPFAATFWSLLPPIVAIVLALISKDPPHYRSIETSRQLITSENRKEHQADIPIRWQLYCKGSLVSKGLYRSGTGSEQITIRYYPDWTFQVHEVDPITGRRIGGSIPTNISADSFKEMVTSANESYGLALQTAGFGIALKISERNSMGRNLKL